MRDPRPLTPSSRPSLFLRDQPLLWRLGGTCTQVRGKEPEGRVQLGRVTPRGGEREAMFLLAASPSSPAAPPPLWVCCLRGLLKNSPERWPFGGHSESMPCIRTLHSLQELPSHISCPDALVIMFRSWSSQVAVHPVKPLATAHKVTQTLTWGCLSVQPSGQPEGCSDLRPGGGLCLSTLSGAPC